MDRQILVVFNDHGKLVTKGIRLLENRETAEKKNDRSFSGEGTLRYSSG